MPWTADGRWVPENDSVSGQLTGLLASDGAYMQTARAAGQRTAGRRGLLNSSIAAGAGESAAISAAAPIASQDASQIFQRNQAVLEGGINLNNQTTLNNQQIAGQKELNTQQNQQQLLAMQKEAEFTRERDIFAQQGATASQLREFDQRSAEQVRQIAAANEQQTASLSSSERQALLSAQTNLQQSQIAASGQISAQYLSAFSQLAGDPNIPADVRNSYIAEFQRVMQQGQALIGVVQNVPLNWGSGAATPPSAAPAAVAPPPVYGRGTNGRMATA